MSKLFITALILIAIFTSAPAMAADSDAVCVQKNLARLDAYSGAIDGIVGRQTRSGISRVISGSGVKNLPNSITVKNTETWCAKLKNIKGLKSTSLPRLAATLYYSAQQDDYASGSSARFRDIDGKVLRKGSNDFKRAASIEGTAVFSNGQVLNYHERVGGEVRWEQTRHGYGIDARGCPLVPFRSAAVDPRVIPLGTKMIIHETRGMRLPGGKTHDGIWYATDTGDGITGKRIDLFTGAGIASMDIVERHNIGHLQRLNTEYLAKNISCKSIR